MDKGTLTAAGDKIRRLEKQVKDAYRVRQILILVEKISEEDFAMAESIVRDLAPTVDGEVTHG